MLARLVAEAHSQREPSAWISGTESVVYPPDLVEHGVDLAALVFVRLRNDAERLRAADTLVRSGGFGLVVVELGASRRAQSVDRRGCRQSRSAGSSHADPSPVDQGQLVRLAGLAKHHDCVLCCVPTTSGGARPGGSSLGSAVSLRVAAERQRHDGVGGDSPAVGGRFAARVRVVKDKRASSESVSGGGRWVATEQVIRGPLGVR